MFKRVLLITLAVGLGLAALQGGTAQAGTWSYVRPPGTWYYYGSIDACATIGSVPDPTKHPALLVCEVQITEVQSLCENPANHQVSPGESATQVTLIGEHQLNQSDLDTKKKGKASACVTISDNCTPDPVTGEVSPLCSDEFCVNPNWNILDVLTLQFLAKCTTQQCTGTDDPNTTDVNEACNTTVVKDTQYCQCTLPSGYSVLNQPTPCADPLHPDPSCTAYECIEVDANLVPTGNLCELQ